MESKLEIYFYDREASHAHIPDELARGISIKGYFGPSHISWQKLVDFSEPFSYLSPKKIKRTEKALVEFNSQFRLGKYDSLTEDRFSEWIQLYSTEIGSKDNSILRADRKWYEANVMDNPEKYKMIAIYNLQNELVGAAIIVRSSETKMQLAYRAHQHIHIKDSSLSEIIEYLVDSYALENNYKIITRGADINLYGPRLSTGLHDFKYGYGYRAHALDHKPGTYFPRHLYIFKAYPEILTYIYGENNELVEQRLPIDGSLKPETLLNSLIK